MWIPFTVKRYSAYGIAADMQPHRQASIPCDRWRTIDRPFRMKNNSQANACINEIITYRSKAVCPIRASMVRRRMPHKRSKQQQQQQTHHFSTARYHSIHSCTRRIVAGACACAASQPTSRILTYTHAHAHNVIVVIVWL